MKAWHVLVGLAVVGGGVYALHRAEPSKDAGKAKPKGAMPEQAPKTTPAVAAPAPAAPAAKPATAASALAAAPLPHAHSPQQSPKAGAPAASAQAPAPAAGDTWTEAQRAQEATDWTKATRAAEEAAGVGASPQELAPQIKEAQASGDPDAIATVLQGATGTATS